MDTQYAIILIKPVALKYGLDELLLQNIRNSTSAEPVFRKLWWPSKEQAARVYPELSGTPEFSMAVRSIVRGHSLFVIVQGSTSLYSDLTTAKGPIKGKSGLRYKYRTCPSGSTGDLLHTTDTVNETVHLCSMAMKYYELNSLEERHSVLASRIRRHTALQVRTE